MNFTNNPGRVAGLLYLLLGVSVYRLQYVPRALFVQGDAASTASNIAAHERLFRLGMVSDLLAGIFAIFLVLAFYRLLKGVDQNQTMGMLTRGGPMPAAVYFFNVINDVAALLLVRRADSLSLFEKPQQDALAMLFLRLHDYGVFANEIFWSLWLIPSGVLVYKSRFLPPHPGPLAYAKRSSLSSYKPYGLPLAAVRAESLEHLFPVAFGEGAIMLWFLMKGAKPQPLGRAAPSSAA